MQAILLYQNLVLFLILILTGFVNTKSYDGYKVYEIIAETHEQADFLHSTSNDVKFDLWREGRNLGDANDIMVAPEDQLNFEKKLTTVGLRYTVVVEDVERLIQREKMERSFSRSAQLGDVTFRNYMLYHEYLWITRKEFLFMMTVLQTGFADIKKGLNTAISLSSWFRANDSLWQQMAYIRKLAQNYPNLVTVESIGQSYEGRDILLLKISSGSSSTATPKPIIFIDAGIHCREWIAPPTALYIIQQLTENSNNAYLYENIDWVVVPNLNPDGYEYTQKEDRLWRKNRRLTEGEACFGTDLNRNFDYFWMYDGASNNSCTEIYAGPEAFSEPESRALRDWIVQNQQNIKLYLTIHSFGEMILYPWGYATILPENAEELQILGERVAAAIDQASSIGSSYVVNTSAIGLSPGAGGSDDWVKAVAEVELAYTLELPNGDAPYWFMLPARQILPVVQETFEGMKIFHNYIEEKFVNNAGRDALLRA